MPAAKCKIRGWSQPAFSLLEMLIVLAILGALLALMTPSLALLNSSALNTSGRKFGDFLNLCRSEAIAQRTAIRLGIVIESPNKEEKFRKYAAWKWDKKSREFLQHSKWHSLPNNVFFSGDLPQKTQEADYAQKEPASIRGDYILDREAESFEHFSTVSKEKRTLHFLDFSPSGRAKVPRGEERNLIVAIHSGSFDIDETTNWVQFTVDTLTGRVRVYRP